MTIPLVVDTRERKPYEFEDYSHVIKRKLDVGDYTLDGYEQTFAVERKSLDDLANSLGTDRDRFEREIVRAQTLKEFVVVIEAPREHVYRFANTGNSPHYFSGIYPNSIIGTVEKWPQKYSPLEFEWCGDRDGAKQRTRELLAKWLVLHG